MDQNLIFCVVLILIVSFSIFNINTDNQPLPAPKV